MAKAIKKGETIPKDGIYSFEWTVKYQEKGLTKIVKYFTINKGGNAWTAVSKRFKAEYPNVVILNISCD